MPSELALLLTTGFVIFLFRRDSRERPPITGALWIPLLWVLITGSRTVSQWLGVGGTYNTPGDLAEGSPLDRLVFLGLQLAALLVLIRRRVSLPTVLSRNIGMTIFLSYCALSILWSDFPFVALKRWVKVLSLPMMGLVIATEPDPREALVRLVKRAAYALVPFSILLIRYYPTLGRSFSEWTGDPHNQGVTTNKNELGYVCLILGFFFVWHLLTILRRSKGPERRRELLLTAAFLGMLGWLIFMAHSATALMSLVLGTSIMLFFGLRFIDRRRSLVYVVAGVLIFSSAEFFFGIADTLTDVLGRDATLSGRLELWDEVRRIDINPMIGAGFESFWLGPRAEFLWAKYWWRPNQAHNGYLETYLNLGWVGVILLVGWILSVFWKGRHTLLSDFDLGRFQLGALAIVLVYNYTEAAFKGIHLIWLFFYLATIDYPPVRPRYAPNFPRPAATPRLSGARGKP